MTVYFTRDARIDRTGRHVMTPAAFADWVSSATWNAETVRDFAFSDRPVPMELPLGYAYARTAFSIKAPGVLSPVALDVYYFVEPAENIAPHTDTLLECDIGEYILRVDWLHTLGIGGIGWLSRGSSILHRTPLLGRGGKYDAGRLDYHDDSVLGQGETTNQYSYVVEVITKRSGSTVFASDRYAKEVLIAREPTGATTAVEVLNKAAHIVSGMSGARYFANSASTGEDVAMTVLAVYLVPRAYIPTSYSTSPQAYPYYVYYQNGGEIFNVEPGEKHYNRSIVYNADAALYEVVIGNGALSVNLPSKTAEHTFRTVSHFSAMSGFSISATIDGRGVDLTPQCRVPFEVVDEASAQTNGQQRALQLATSAISVGVGVASQNPVAVVGGLISGASQMLTSPSSAPMQSSGGDCYSQQMYYRWGLLHAVRFSKDAETRFINRSRGPYGAIDASYIADELSYWTDTVTPHVCYFEGDVYLTRNGSSFLDNLLEGYSDRLTAAFADGVFIWTSASHYRGNVFL